jgi:iron complex outermembrane receptor protein
MSNRVSVSRQRHAVLRCFAFALALGVVSRGLLFAQAVPGGAPQPTKLPSIIVTSQKEAQALQDLPASVTATTRSLLEDSGVRYVNDAAMFAPNIALTEFSARKLSNPRFRGIGSSPNNPAVTTYIDGVPQLNANTSSLELIDIEQIEFVRGPQGALFGRNTVGGLINVSSIRPALDRASGGVTVGLGDYGLREARFTVAAPLVQNEAGVSFAGGFSGRDGYVTNPLTGHDLDWREAYFGKAQLFWNLSKEWSARVILSGERARDGDYRLNDLLSVRANPSLAPRNFEGFTHRDVLAPTLLVTGKSGTMDLAFTTGAVSWKTIDATDLDYSPAPLIERENREKGKQLSQEIRASSPGNSSDALTWQAGAFYFWQDYDQMTFNYFPNPVFVRYPVGTPAFRSFTLAKLEDQGLGVFGQATFKPNAETTLSVGVRGDYEDKTADLRSFTVPAGLGAVTMQALSDDFSELSPHASASFRVAPDQLTYVAIARGYKAGGFNAASPAGTERFEQETSWNYEAGWKGTWLNQKLRTNLAAFHTRWSDLQLNVPAMVPGQFYLANVGSAASKGIEFEVTARPAAGWEVFGNAGWLSAKFRGGSHSEGRSVAGNRVPLTPKYTASGGVQCSFAIDRDLTAYVRGEVTAFGKYYYDDHNSRSQGLYSLTNLRVGLRGRQWTAEAWVRNAFDEVYVPLAIPYPGLAPSGFVGESGAPVTMGVSVGWRY